MWDSTIIGSSRSDGTLVNQLQKIIAAFAAALVLVPAVAGAVSLELPNNAALQVERSVPLGSLRLPMAPWQAEGLAVDRMEGAVRHEAWRLGGGGITTLQIMRPIREQLLESGFEILLECRAANCGGFDFLRAIDVLPPPKMYVDLTGFRYLSARSADGNTGVTILVSRSEAAAFVQVSSVVPEDSVTQVLATAGGVALGGTQRMDVADQADAAQRGFAGDPRASLAEVGRLVLDDLRFDSGAATLAAGPFAMLEAVAEYLKADPNHRLALVGHTDAVGALENNVALSRRRAEAVKERLVARYGVDEAQLTAEGVGYLAPIASNATEAGREANRRVEAVVLTVR